MSNEIVIFTTEDGKVSLDVQMENETVWLSRNQIAELFDRDIKTIGKHINNALKEEVDISTVSKFATVKARREGSDGERCDELYWTSKMKHHLRGIRPFSGSN